MRFYRGKVLHFWRTQPGEKLKLSAQAVWMLWRPTPTEPRVTTRRSRLGPRP